MTPALRRSSLVAALTVLATLPVSAQQYVRLGTELDDYLGFLRVAGLLSNAPLVFRSPSTLAGSVPRDNTAPPWSGHVALQDSELASAGLSLRVLDPDWQVVYNSRYPRDYNDGVLWAGRGASTALSAGARLRWGPLSVVFDPTVYYSQNRSFDLAPDSGQGIDRADLSRLAYPWQMGRIDWPERFGDGALAAADWGQSGIRLDVHHLTLGLSTENMWWGPAQRTPIIMSNTAPGFPHLDVGTNGPIDIGIGRAEARILWGRLAESGYFDTVPTNNGRLFSGAVLGIQPRWVNGLTLGITRVFYQTWDSLRVADFVDVFQSVFKQSFSSPTNPEGNDLRDQMLSLIARWTFPDAGFEAYVEWARNDHNADLRDFVLEPDHSRAYTLGFQQLFKSGIARFRLRGETTTLGRAATIAVRAEPTYYVHHVVRQGYTNRGQLLGAAIGPGSQSQWLAVDRYDQNGRLGIAFGRVRFDDDAYYRSFAGPNQFGGQQTELTATLSAARFVGPTDISAALALSRELNRHYVVRNDVTNLQLDFKVAWRLSRRPGPPRAP